MAACSKCSEEVPAEASFCPHCGTRFDTPKSVPPPASAPLAPAAADPFSHTVPADPGELARLSDMIAAQRSKAPLPPPAPVPVRERQFGRTKALEAVEDRRTEPPAEQPQGERIARERTMASPQIPAPPLPPVPPPPQVAVQTPPAGMRVSPISPKAATTAQPAVHIVGAAVRVVWTDGQTYAATIVQVTPTHCSVRFANGSLQWIEHGKVFPG